MSSKSWLRSDVDNLNMLDRSLATICDVACERPRFEILKQTKVFRFSFIIREKSQNCEVEINKTYPHGNS